MKKTILLIPALSLTLAAPVLAHPGHGVAGFHAHYRQADAAAVTTPADALKAGHDHHAAGHADHKGNPCAAMSPSQAMKEHHPVRGPLAKGLESFHDTLHGLVHDAMPKGDLAAVKAKVPELKQKADALAAINLPPAARKQRAKRDALLRAVADLEASVKSDDKKFEAAFDHVHHSFEELAMASKRRGR